MVYANPFLRVRLEGTLGASEVFSFGINLISDGPWTPPAPITQSMADAVALWFTSESNIASAADLHTLKVNLIGVDGRYVEETTNRWDYGSPYPSGNVTAPFPFQIALVISLLAANDRGRASHGRFYLPVPTGGLEGPDQTLPTTFQESYLAAGVSLLELLEQELPGWQPGLVSNVGAGAQALITRVRVGRVLDTIRSRRNKVVEEYIEATL
jgi:hypothetical protein